MAAPSPAGRGPSAPSTSSSSSSTTEGSRLRARKLSLSTHRLPHASQSSSQLSPSSTSYSPSSRTDPSLSLSEVGLGLMLDDNGVQSPRVSVDGSTQAGRARGNSNSTPSSSAAVASAGQAADETDEFFLAAGAAGGAAGQELRRTPSGRILKPSTVTTAQGGTASPLPIFTGSPQPTQYASPLPSPVPTPRSFSPAPSHQAYNLGGPSSSSSSSAPSAAAALTSLSSAPMTRPPSYNSIMSSTPMDRTRSNGSDIHSRQQSLTSACPPVTAGGLGTPKSDVTAFGSPAMGGNRGGNWRAYDWGVGGGGGGSAAASEKGYDSGEDVREGGKRRAGSLGGANDDGLVGRVLAAPRTALSLFLQGGSSSTSQQGAYGRLPHSPPLNGSAKPPPGGAPNGGGKRYPFPIRLLTFAYLIFSFLYLSLSLSQCLLGSSDTAKDPESSSRLAALRARLGARGGAGQEGWQMMREYADGLGGWVGYKSGGETAEAVGKPVEEESEQEEVQWGPVRRVGHPDNAKSALLMQDPKNNPLTSFSHTYRFSKMHDKSHWDLHDEIIPFAFHAAEKAGKTDVTACLYTNEAWLDMLPSFVHTWRGPVSLVFESTHSRFDETARSALLARIDALRESDPLVRQFVDVHLVGAPSSMSARTLSKTRERMIKNPVALNYQLNLARFFAQTDVVFLVGDARVTPSGGLRRKLAGPGIRSLVMERGDALVVPTFGFVRDPTGEPSDLPSLPDLRTKLGLSQTDANADNDEEEHEPISSDPFAGVSADEFAPLAAEHMHTLVETLPLAPSDWPTRKSQLVSLVNTRVPSIESPTTAKLALHDRRWDLNHGPSNWYLWRKSSTDPRLLENPTSGGGLGLGLDGAVGGGKEVYRVVDYDLHYAPLVVVSRQGQPWCTERFEEVRAACVYQMYLSGAEMWVVPDEWAYTLEVLEKKPEGVKEDPAEKLKNSISSRLYGKFHQEACMHYGREFLSIGMWDSDKAQHLRETCARTLGSWGMGSG
ncbi:hypothetical protein JCM8547_000758 [Rhodosporidiobolus lusitaniae]